MSKKKSEVAKVRKNATVIRPSDEVIAEISNTGKAIGTEIIQVAPIEPICADKALRRIDDNGNLNLKGVSEEEIAEYHAIASKLDMRDKMSISNYGAELSAQLNKSTKELMSLGRTTGVGSETEEIMKSINSKLMNIDLDEIKKPNALVRFVRKIPLLNKVMFSVKKFLDKYDSLEEKVKKMHEKLQAAQAIALRDNTELEKRFQDTVAYVGVLEKLIVAAKIKSEEYGKAIEQMEADPSNYPAITIHDAKTFKHELDKRISSMLTWHLSFNQSLFRIRDIQDANISHSNAISETIDNMMPQLRDQLHQAIVLYNLEQGVKAHEVMINGFNEIIKHNADATHDIKVRVTEMTERTAISLETLKHNQEKIKETYTDVLRIMDEAAKQRMTNEAEMAKMERELDNMLTGSSNVTPTLVEAKYTEN